MVCSGGGGETFLVVNKPMSPFGQSNPELSGLLLHPAVPRQPPWEDICPLPLVKPRDLPMDLLRSALAV